MTGEIDRDNASRLRELLIRSVERCGAHGRVRCDLSRVPLLDAAGVGALLATADAARVRGVALEIAGLPRRIAEISGFTSDRVGVMGADQREWSGPVTTRLRCCVCGDDTEGADDYVVLALFAEPSSAIQYLGAHAGHFDAALAPGFHLDGGR